jgi:hypothetical protein
VKNNEDDNDQPTTDERHSEHGSDTAADGGTANNSAAADISPASSPSGGLLKSGSSGRLPDMLTHTPDGQQGQGRNAAGVPAVISVVLTEVVVLKREDETEITPDKTAGKVPYLALFPYVS